MSTQYLSAWPLATLSAFVLAILTEVALRRLRHQQENRRPPLLTCLRPLLVAAGLLLLFGLIVEGPRLREQQLEALAEANMMRLGEVFQQFSAQSQGEVYPPAAPFPEVWAPDLSVLYPEFLPDPTLLVDPRLPTAPKLRRQMRGALEQSPPDYELAAQIAAQSYVYTGRLLMNTSDALNLFLSLKQQPDSNRRLPHPLREGIERFVAPSIGPRVYGESARAQIPVLFEVIKRPFPTHIWVLYLDGSVAKIPYGHVFPAVYETTLLLVPPDLPKD